jgi:hypothetical protein
MQTRRQSFFSGIVRNFDRPPLPGSCIPAHNVFGFPHRKPIEEAWPTLRKRKPSLVIHHSGLLRATVFRHFLGFLGLHDFAALYVEGLKAYDSEGDNCDFPCKTRVLKGWGLSPPSPQAKTPSVTSGTTLTERTPALRDPNAADS